LFRFISFNIFIFRFNLHTLMEDARIFSIFFEDQKQAKSKMRGDGARGADSRAPLTGGLKAVKCADQQPGDKPGLSDRLVRIFI